MFKGVILIILMAVLAGGGYFFAENNLDNGFSANLSELSGGYQLVEEISLRKDENVAQNVSRKIITENKIESQNMPKGKDVENKSQEAKDVTSDEAKEVALTLIRKDCSLMETQIASFGAIIINEVSWAGTASDKTSHEWIELKNISSSSVNLSGWHLTNKSGVLKVDFESGDIIPAGGFYLLERTDDDAVMTMEADKIFVNAIKNSDESLKLFNKDCLIADEFKTDGDENWLAGNAAPDYRTAERVADLTWHTYSGNGADGIFGTPKMENSPAVSNEVSVASFSNGNSSDYGSNGFSVVDSGGNSPPPPPPPPIPNIGAIYISEVMAGMDGNADYEFVEIYNPNTFDISLTDWSVKKKSSTGSESSLVAASRLEGKIIKAGKYLLFAREESYNSPVAPDVKWASSYSLAYTNNSVAIFNVLGQKVDETSWTEIPKGQSWERAAWTTSEFHLQIFPNPYNSNN